MKMAVNVIIGRRASLRQVLCSNQSSFRLDLTIRPRPCQLRQNAVYTHDQLRRRKDFWFNIYSHAFAITRSLTRRDLAFGAGICQSQFMLDPPPSRRV